jgi:hypothetical protein
MRHLLRLAQINPIYWRAVLVLATLAAVALGIGAPDESTWP